MAAPASSRLPQTPRDSRAGRAALPAIMTDAEFDALPDGVTRSLELYAGRVREKMSPFARHGRYQVRIAKVLDVWAQSCDAGVVYAEVHFRISRDPAYRFVPDVAFVNAKRALAPDDSDNQIYDGPPDLAVEIVSQRDTPASVFEKVATYLKHGTPLVWVVDPDTRSISVHAPDTTPVVLVETALIDGGSVLPGFRVTVAQLLDGDISVFVTPKRRARGPAKRRK